MDKYDERSAAGLEMRKQVLGADYVERSLANSNDFSAPLQDFLNENCWGLVWTREGLDPKIRSVVTLTALAAGNKWNEFRTHIRGAMNNGWTSDELREMILHMAVYLGVPTALEAFRAASEVVNEKA
ncbi:MAG: carboxymuconolactone decarboxylase family protein [Actinomycetes bacterium]|jgi:4-carboxymuconolactone decarboxylase